MKKLGKRGSHVGIIISFNLFILFLFSIFLLINPFLKERAEKKPVLESTYQKILENVSSNVTITLVKMMSVDCDSYENLNHSIQPLSKVYQKGGTAPTNPFDYTAEIVSGGYANLTSDDNIYLATSLANIDQQYDSQIFHFNISNSILNSSSININWKGKSGEQSYVGYDLTAYIWKVSNSSWEQINTDSDGSTTEVSWTKNITSNTLNYVNSTNSGKFVYVMVKFKKRIDCAATCCGLLGCYSGQQAGYCADGYPCCTTCVYYGGGGSLSCPYFYSWNGTDYVFDSEGITAFGLISDNEGKQPSRLPNLKSVNGTVKIKVTEELPEISHIDSVELLKVTHSENVSVYPGYKEKSLKGYPKVLGFDVPLFIFKYFKKKGDSVVKQFFEKEDVSTIFTLYTLKNQIKPLKVTENGKEVKELFEIDGKFWNKDFEGMNLSDEDGDGLLDITNFEEFIRSAEFTYPREETDKAKLRINVKETDYMPFVASLTIESAKRLGVYDAKKLLKNAPRDSAYNISIWDGEKWGEPLYVNLYPRELSTDVIVPLNLTGVNTPYLKVKIQAPYGTLQLDGAYIDYSEDEEIIIERIPLKSAVDNNGKDIAKTLSNNDNKKIIMERGDYLNLEFEGDDENATFFLNMRGYYEASSFRENYIISNKEIIEKIYDDETFGKRYWRLKFLESQASCSGNVNNNSNSEDEHNTLYTDYVEVKWANVCTYSSGGEEYFSEGYNPENKKCIRLDGGGWKSGENITVINDNNGVVASNFTSSGLDINWTEESVFLKIFSSLENFEMMPLTSNDCAIPTENTHFFISSIKIEEYLFESKLIQFEKTYNSSYETLKNYLKIPLEEEFSFSLMNSDGEVLLKGRDAPLNANVYSKREYINYMDNKSQILPGIITIQVW